MTSASLTEQLLDEFSTRLDSALVLAIAAEVTEGDRDAEITARATLQALADAQEPLDEHGGAQSDTWNGLSSRSDTDATETTLDSTTTDEEAVERAFQAWSLEEVEANSEPLDQSIRISATESNLELLAEDPLAFLKNLFPNRERVELQLAYDDAGQDIEGCIETLLTEDFLIREEEEYLRALSQADAQSDGEGGSGKTKKHRQRIRKPGKQTVSLTSTPRGVSLPSRSVNEPAKAQRNVWAQTDSSVLYLSQLLSVPPGTLSSLFYSNNNSLPLAVSKILDQAELYHDDLQDEDAKLAELRQLFPLQPLDALRRCLYATDGELPKTVELYKVLEEIHATEGTPLAHNILLAAKPDKPRQTALAAAPGAARQAEALRESRQQPGKPKERPPTAQECLILASTIRNKRDDAYRSAARTWRTKHAIGNSGVAAYWADHARQLDREARSWELRAARATVEERRTQARTAQSIDLHGLTASQALTVTSESLVSWWHNASAPPSLTIITGAGKHSAGQAPIILPAVKKLLEREGYDWKYEGSTLHRGSLVVTGLQGRRKSSGW